MDSIVKILCLSVLTVGLFCAPVCQAEDLAGVALKHGKKNQSKVISAFSDEDLYWNVKNGSKEKSLEYSIVRYPDGFRETVKNGTVAPGEEISGFLRVESPEARLIPKSMISLQQHGNNGTRSRQQSQPGDYAIKISCDESNSRSTARLFTISGYNPRIGETEVDLALDEKSVVSEELTASEGNFVFCHIKNTSEDKTASLHYQVYTKNPFDGKPLVVKEGQVAPGKEIYDAFHATNKETLSIDGSLVSTGGYFIELSQGQQKATGRARLAVLEPRGEDGWYSMGMFF